MLSQYFLLLAFVLAIHFGPVDEAVSEMVRTSSEPPLGGRLTTSVTPSGSRTKMKGDGVRVRLMIPKLVRAGSAATLVCQYDLSDKPLYAVKWYRGNHEFFRYVPQATPPMVSFSARGLHVDLSGSNAHQVTLLDVPVSISGVVSCEVSTDVTFSTASDSAYLNVIDANVRKPTLEVTRAITAGVDGEMFLVNCSAQATDPPPEISFFIDSNKVDPSIVREFGPGQAVLPLSAMAIGFLSDEDETALEPDGIKIVRVRCEASLKGVYFVSSPSLAIEIGINLPSQEGFQESGSSSAHIIPYFLFISVIFVVMSLR